MSAPTYNWQQKGWPRFTYNRAHLSVVRESRATVKRVLSALIAEGKIEHRGSKKTGGYYIKQ